MDGRLLVVEDDAAMGGLLKEALGRRGFSVEVRTTGEEGLRWLAENELDIVLTDLHLGKMSGLSLCEQVAQGRPDLPVVVLTAFGSMESAVAAIRAGAYDYVTKPC